MSDLKNNLQSFLEKIAHKPVKLVAVSKTKPVEVLQEAYDLAWRRFGENKVQEMVAKYEKLPKDIEWHLIGTLQSNKVKFIAPFVSLIHSVDRPKILAEINRQAQNHNRIIDCLLQIHIAEEESKSGFSYAEAEDFLRSVEAASYKNIRLLGLMGMATFTDNTEKIRQEFRGLKAFFDRMKEEIRIPQVDFKELSMGMSGDYEIAIEEGSTIIRVGSAIFGSRA